MPPPSKRRLSAEARRAQLLDVALDLAAGGDVATISVADLAAAAGVSEGLLYHYFPTKQALVVAAVRRAADDLLSELEASSGASPAERLAAGLAAYLDHVQAQPTGWRAVLAATTGELAEVAAEVEQRSRQLLLDLLGIPTPSPALEVAIAGWEAFERGACAAWLSQSTLARPAVEEMLSEAFVAALGAAARHDAEAAAGLERLLQS